MIRLYVFFVFLFSLQAYGEGIRIEDKKSNYGCTYKHDDFYLKKIPKTRVFEDNDLLWELQGRQEHFYKYLKDNVPVYHYYREEYSWSPGSYLDTVFFEINNDRVNFYAGVVNSELKIAGFCLEANFSSNLVDDFLPKEKISSLKLEGEGDFYVITNYSNDILKIVKDKSGITDIYIYIEVD